MPGQVIPRETPKKGSSSEMAFGSSVDTLIEVYSNCISLLKAFRRRGEGAASRRDEHDRQQVQLRKSLKSDRARVQRAYSSAVSDAGSRFEKGDGKNITRTLRYSMTKTNTMFLDGKTARDQL
jgi:predicted aminopeptidase